MFQLLVDAKNVADGTYYYPSAGGVALSSGIHISRFDVSALMAAGNSITLTVEYEDKGAWIDVTPVLYEEITGDTRQASFVLSPAGRRDVWLRLRDHQYALMRVKSVVSGGGKAVPAIHAGLTDAAVVPSTAWDTSPTPGLSQEPARSDHTHGSQSSEISSPLSYSTGVEATKDNELPTKKYVDDHIITDHSSLTNLGFAASGHTGFAAASHSHAASDVTSGTLDGDRLPAMSTTKAGAVPATGAPSGKFLKDNGSWDSAGGGGVVRYLPGATAMSRVTFAGLVSHGSPNTAYTLPTDRMYALPFIADDAVVRKVIAIGIQGRSTHANLKVRMGIYGNSTTPGDIRPGALLVDCGAISVNVNNTVFEWTAGLPLVLDHGGLYHIAASLEFTDGGGARSVTAFTDEQQVRSHYGASRSDYWYTAGSAPGVYLIRAMGAFPNPFGAPSGYMALGTTICMGVALDPV